MGFAQALQGGRGHDGISEPVYASDQDSFLGDHRVDQKGPPLRGMTGIEFASSSRTRESAGKPLLTHIFGCVTLNGESQRDSAIKPRVARNELPWEMVSDM